MRPAELVVKYLEGPALPTDSVEYGGVFICDEEVEEAFAAAEPPAHDDWIPDNLTGRDKTFVRVALRRIRDTVNEYAAPAQVPATAAEATLPLGALGMLWEGFYLVSRGKGCRNRQVARVCRSRRETQPFELEDRSQLAFRWYDGRLARCSRSTSLAEGTKRSPSSAKRKLL